MQSRKLFDFFEVCKYDMFCVNFHSVTVHNSAVMKFWPALLEQRIKLVLNLFRQTFLSILSDLFSSLDF